jgi:hypothetical protein
MIPGTHRSPPTNRQRASQNVIEFIPLLPKCAAGIARRIVAVRSPKKESCADGWKSPQHARWRARRSGAGQPVLPSPIGSGPRLQALEDDLLKARRNIRIKLARRCRRLVQDISCQSRGSATFKRTPARDHFVQHRADGPDVAARVCSFATQLLGRHIRQRARGN